MDVTITWLPVDADPDAFVVTDAERDRAARFRRPRDTARSLLGAGLVRAVVAGLVGVRAREVGIDRRCGTCGEQHGRPVVALPAAAPPHVSVTHAGEWVGVAVCPSAPVGLDVEPFTGSAAPVDVVAAVAERPAIERSANPARAFTRMWVAKEAALKAVGHGLAVDPAKVVLAADGRGVLGWPLADNPRGAAIRSVDPDGDHAAAVCVLSASDPVVRSVISSSGWTAAPRE